MCRGHTRRDPQFRADCGTFDVAAKQHQLKRFSGWCGRRGDDTTGKITVENVTGNASQRREENAAVRYAALARGEAAQGSSGDAPGRIGKGRGPGQLSGDSG